jgi:hypothetical protein
MVNTPVLKQHRRGFANIYNDLPIVSSPISANPAHGQSAELIGNCCQRHGIGLLTAAKLWRNVNGMHHTEHIRRWL